MICATEEVARIVIEFAFLFGWIIGWTAMPGSRTIVLMMFVRSVGSAFDR